MAKLSYLEAIRQAQDLALQQNKDVFILGEDVGRKGGVFWYYSRTATKIW